MAKRNLKLPKYQKQQSAYRTYSQACIKADAGILRAKKNSHKISTRNRLQQQRRRDKIDGHKSDA